ncbi:MATE family efflux transporter [Vibrio algarum]
MTYLMPAQSGQPHLFKRIIKLALPVAIQSALVSILALADVLMVSDFGKEATASVGIASKWHFVAIMIMVGLSVSNGVLVSQYWGKGDRNSAKSVTLYAMRVGSVIIIPVTVLITLFSGLIMQAQTADVAVIELGSQYLWYSFPVLILTHFVIVLESSMRSSGDAVTPLYVGALTVLINIALNFWLIKGGFGISPMGVAGAALATTISRLLQVVLMYSYMRIKRHWLFTAKQVACPKKLHKSYRKLAFPNASNGLLWAVGTLTYQMIFGHMGTTELAVFSMLGPFESLCYATFFGISVACSVLIGQSLGKDQFEEAVQLTRILLKFVLVFGLFLGAALLMNREWILVLLNLDASQFYHLSLPAISILCCGIWLRMLNLIIINGILRAGGDNLFCLRMDFIAMWLVGIPLATYGAFIGEWGFAWVYAMLICEEVVKFSLCFHRYLKLKWVNNLTISHA